MNLCNWMAKQRPEVMGQIFLRGYTTDSRLGRNMITEKHYQLSKTQHKAERVRLCCVNIPRNSYLFNLKILSQVKVLPRIEHKSVIHTLFCRQPNSSFLELDIFLLRSNLSFSVFGYVFSFHNSCQNNINLFLTLLLYFISLLYFILYHFYYTPF